MLNSRAVYGEEDDDDNDCIILWIKRRGGDDDDANSKQEFFDPLLVTPCEFWLLWMCSQFGDDVMIKALKSEVSHLQGKHVEDE